MIMKEDDGADDDDDWQENISESSFYGFFCS